MQGITKEKDKIVMFSGPATTALTNADCSPVGFHRMFDTHALSVGVQAMVKKGGESWFFIVVDYAFGRALQKGFEAIVKKLGGTVVGSVLHPLNAPDFAALLVFLSDLRALGLENAQGLTYVDSFY